MRLYSLDFFRGISLVLMIIIHVAQQNSSDSFQESIFFNVIQNLNAAFVPASFIFIMGMALYLAPQKNFLSNLKRGFSIFLLGYLLNFFRGFLPSFLSLFFVEKMDFYPSILSSFHFLLEFDILQFAGISIILFSCFRNFFSDFFIILILPFFLALFYVDFSSFFVSFEDSILNHFFSMFVGKNNTIFFPVFPWFFFCILGFSYAGLFKKFHLNRFFLPISFFIGVLSSLIGFFFFKTKTCTEEYLHLCTFNSPPLFSLLFMTGNIIAIFSLLTIFYPKNQNKFILKMYYWSKHTTSFYFIQWVIIGFLSSFLATQNFIGTFLLFIFVLLLTDIFLFLWIYLTSNRNKRPRAS